MRFVRGARIGLLLACLPIFNLGCVSLSPKLSTLPSIAKDRANVQYQTARDAEQRGHWQKACELYTTLHRNSPDNPAYSHRLGVVYTQMGQFEFAKKFFEHARSLDAHNPVLLSDMGYSCYLQKDYRQSEELLAKAVQLRPDDARSVNNLAMSIGFQRRYDESLLMFRRVNDETQSLLNLAYVCTQLNEADAAIALYQQVLTNDPANRVATNALQQLRPNRPVATSSQYASRSELQPAVSDKDVPAPLPPWAAEPQVVSKNEAASTPTGPVTIVSASEAPPPPSDFQLPLIVPFNSPSDPSTVATQAAPRRIEVDLDDASLQLPPPPAELAAVDHEEIADQAVSAPSGDESNRAFEEKDNLPEPAGKESEELTGLVWAKPELSQQSDVANQSETGGVAKNDRFRGFCPVAIRDERRLRTSRNEFLLEFQGQTYRFNSAKALIKFQEHPDWYVPVAGGMDIIEIQRGQPVVRGSLDFAVWFHHRLHMFSSAENLAMFRADPRQFASNP